MEACGRQSGVSVATDTYDPAGNRLTRSGAGVPSSVYTYTNNRLVSVGSPASAVLYDADGNPLRSYVWGQGIDNNPDRMKKLLSKSNGAHYVNWGCRGGAYAAKLTKIAKTFDADARLSATDFSCAPEELSDDIPD